MIKKVITKVVKKITNYKKKNVKRFLIIVLIINLISAVLFISYGLKDISRHVEDLNKQEEVTLTDTGSVEKTFKVIKEERITRIKEKKDSLVDEWRGDFLNEVADAGDMPASGDPLDTFGTTVFESLANNVDGGILYSSFMDGYNKSDGVDIISLDFSSCRSNNGVLFICKKKELSIIYLEELFSGYSHLKKLKSDFLKILNTKNNITLEMYESDSNLYIYLNHSLR